MIYMTYNYCTHFFQVSHKCIFSFTCSFSFHHYFVQIQFFVLMCIKYNVFIYIYMAHFFKVICIIAFVSMYVYRLMGQDHIFLYMLFLSPSTFRCIFFVLTCIKYNVSIYIYIWHIFQGPSM